MNVCIETVLDSVCLELCTYIEAYEGGGVR